MSPAAFTVSVEPDRDLVRVTVAGFFGPADVARLRDALADAYRRLRCPVSEHVTLVDARALDIQARDGVTEFQRMLADRDTAGRRIAFVVARSLARAQVRRAADGRDAGFFPLPGEAESWLTADRAAAA